MAETRIHPGWFDSYTYCPGRRAGANHLGNEVGLMLMSAGGDKLSSRQTRRGEEGRARDVGSVGLAVFRTRRAG